MDGKIYYSGPDGSPVKNYEGLHRPCGYQCFVGASKVFCFVFSVLMWCGVNALGIVLDALQGTGASVNGTAGGQVLEVIPNADS